MKEIAEKVKEVWKGVFNEEPEIRVEKDEIIIDTYLSIYKHTFDVYRKSICGTDKRTVKGYRSAMWLSIPQTRWEPEDVDESDLGDYEHVSGAITAIIHAHAENILNQILEGWELEEMYGE